MLQRWTVISILIILYNKSYGFLELSQLSANENKRLHENKIVADSNVETISKNNKDFQSLALYGASYHQNSCEDVFKVLGEYENYQNIIGFIKISTYDPKSKKVFFTLSHFLLPFDMYLSFKIPRIRGSGRYTFIFETGFLQGLTGEILIEEAKLNNFQCFISLQIDWEGTPSPFPNFMFSYFSKKLIETSIEVLWEKSGHNF